MSVTGGSSAFSRPSSEVITVAVWLGASRGPQAQLVCSTTQVAVSPFAPDTDVPGSLPACHATGETELKPSDLLKSRLVRNGEQSLCPVFCLRRRCYSERNYGRLHCAGLLK